MARAAAFRAAATAPRCVPRFSSSRFTASGAEAALSSALDGVEASLRVSRKLGYVDDGESWMEVRGERRLDRHLRLTRDHWIDQERISVRDQRARAVLPAIWVERSARALGSGLLSRLENEFSAATLIKGAARLRASSARASAPDGTFGHR